MVTLRFEIRSISLQNMKETEELEGNNNSELPQTGNISIDYSHLLCRIVCVRALEMLN